MNELKNNEWKTRSDVAKGLLDLVRPLKPYYNEEKSMLKIGNTSAHYGEKPARMEGWARVLWGLGPLFASGNKDLDGKSQTEIAEWKSLYLTGLINGTNPDSRGYWGDMWDYDQKMVETASLAVALSLAGDALWEPLSFEEKIRVETWIRQINTHLIHPNNWRFFRILSNMAFARLGLEYDKKSIVDDFGVIESCYMDNGWYFDGHDGQIDYYIPFAMHFYGLIWASLAPDINSDDESAFYFGHEYKEMLIKRAVKFAEGYRTWFSNDGAEVPFGRSLTYRYAHAAFWSALVFALDKCEIKNEELMGEAKRLLLANFRSWFKNPITDAEGFLTIGYRYPNLFMSERYNAPGSPYWSFKAFLFLALSDTSGLWSTPERDYEVQEKSLLKTPHILVCHDMINGSDNVTLFPTGQHAMEFGNCDSKYKKFVYSNRFGFSVQRGNGLDDGAFDNVLVVSRKGENFYRIAKCLEWEISESHTRTVSSPFDGVITDTYVIPCGGGWHVRVHKINTDFDIDTADGGFAIPIEKPFEINEDSGKGFLNIEEPTVKDGAQLLSAAWGSAGIYCSDAEAEIKFVRAFPNTNLMAPLTVIPYAVRALEKGRHIFMDAFYGADSEYIEKMPVIKKDGNKIEIYSAKDESSLLWSMNF